MELSTTPPVRRLRSLFLSDLHLGAPGCRAEAILAFLRQHDADTIYLVGDTFDLWDPLFAHWSETHDRIVGLLRDRAAAGRRVVLLVGNHDRALLTDRGKAHPGVAGLAAAVAHDHIHHAGDGQRYLVLHGDVCDARLLRFHVWTRLGSRTDSFLRLLDRGLRRMRLRFGPEARGPMELAICALNGLMYRGRRHERRLVQLARAAGCHGVICGHFHIAALHDDHGLRYANCGDWTDSCTALIEDHGGTLSLVAHGTSPAPARPVAATRTARP